MAVIEKKIRLSSLDDEMPFGQYRGDTLREILEKDPSYVLWMGDKFDLDVSILDLAYEHTYRDKMNGFMNKEDFYWDDDS